MGSPKLLCSGHYGKSKLEPCVARLSLLAFTPVTYCCKLLGIHSLTIFL